MRNLVIFGDSISKGIIYEDGSIKRAVRSAVDILACHYSFDTVKNYSVYGQTLARLMRKGTIDAYLKTVDPSAKNYAALCIGGNDADYDWRTIAQSPLENHISLTPIEEYASLLDVAVKKLINAGHKVILFTLPPVFSYQYFNNVISKIADGEKIMQFLNGDVSNIYRHQELFNYEVIKCAYNNGTKLIDIRAALLGDKDCFGKYCIDGVHPNQIGYNFIADTIINCA